MDVDLPFRVLAVADLAGHEDRAWHVAWNTKKPLIASCSADKTVRLYSYASAASASDGDAADEFNFHHLTTIPTGHAKTVRALAWAPSGESIATASFDANIGIWERESGEEWECVATLEGHETECKSVAYSCNGEYLASCSRDKTVWLWQALPDGEFETVSVLMEHTQDVKSVAWHPTEEILASASYDDTIKLYIEDPSDDWFCFSTLTGHTSTVWSLAWSPLGSYLASSSDDKTIRIWRRVAEHKWESVLVLTGHERSIYSVSWGRGAVGAGAGADDKRAKEWLGWLAAVGSDGKILVWQLEEPTSDESSAQSSPPLKYKLIARLESAHGVHDVNSVAWCPREGHERLLATTGDDGHVKIWRIVDS